VTYSLKKDRILKNKKAIQALFAQGRWIRTPLFHIVYRYSGDTRFLFTAQRSVGSAVNRNFAKRYLRETVRQNPDAIPSGFHFGFVARSTPERRSLILYETQLKKAFLHLS